jgi:hypothetical protein
MLPPVVTKTIEHLTSAIISFAVIMVAGLLLLCYWLVHLAENLQLSAKQFLALLVLAA